MAPDHSSAAPSSGAAGSPPANAPGGRTPQRVLTALAGLGVIASLGGAFVLTYDDLRVLALAGGAAPRWAPLYPVLVDVLITVTVLALVVARHARWWTRWIRWALLLAVVAGAAAAAVQRAVKGYEPLPDDALKAGVAVAPYVMLIVVVWLWLAMFRQIHRTAPPAPAPPPAEPVTGPVEAAPTQTAEVETAPVEAAAPPLALAAARSDEAWLFGGADDDRRADEEHTAPHPLPQDTPQNFEGDAAPDSFQPARQSAPPLNLDKPAASFPAGAPPLYSPPPFDDEPDWRPPLPEQGGEVDVDDDPTPPGEQPAPALLPTDVELVGSGNRPKPEVKPAPTTRPDIVMPSAEELAAAAAETGEEAGSAPADRAEDPDGGDAEPSPPSGNLRSSPTPPRE